VEVQLHAFLTWALDGDEWSVSRPDRFTSGERAPARNFFLLVKCYSCQIRGWGKEFLSEIKIFFCKNHTCWRNSDWWWGLELPVRKI